LGAKNFILTPTYTWHLGSRRYTLDLQSPSSSSSSFMTTGLLGAIRLHPGTDISVKCPNPAHDTLLQVDTYCKLFASQMLMAFKTDKNTGHQTGTVGKVVQRLSVLIP